MFSMLATMEDGRTVEVGPIGNEGLVGVRVALGVMTTPDRVIAHIAGTALRLNPAGFIAELKIGRTPLVGSSQHATENVDDNDRAHECVQQTAQPLNSNSLAGF